MSMFVLSKWQCVALQTRWRASVLALFYCYLTFLYHRTNISRKVRALRRVSTSGAPNKFQNCHMDKTNRDKTSQHREGTQTVLLNSVHTKDVYLNVTKIIPESWICWKSFKICRNFSFSWMLYFRISQGEHELFRIFASTHVSNSNSFIHS